MRLIGLLVDNSMETSNFVVQNYAKSLCPWFDSEWHHLRSASTVSCRRFFCALRGWFSRFLTPKVKPKFTMNTGINILCYRSKTLANGEHPLMIRVCREGKKRYQSLGISVRAAKPTNWSVCRYSQPPRRYPHVMQIVQPLTCFRFFYPRIEQNNSNEIASTRWLLKWTVNWKR